MNVKTMRSSVLSSVVNGSEFRLLIIPQEEKASVLMDAYQYIMKLQKSVDELTTELVPLSTTSANPNGLLFQEAQDAQSTSSNSICLLYQHPMVRSQLHLPNRRITHATHSLTNLSKRVHQV